MRKDHSSLTVAAWNAHFALGGGRVGIAGLADALGGGRVGLAGLAHALGGGRVRLAGLAVALSGLLVQLAGHIFGDFRPGELAREQSEANQTLATCENADGTVAQRAGDVVMLIAKDA